MSALSGQGRRAGGHCAGCPSGLRVSPESLDATGHMPYGRRVHPLVAMRHWGLGQWSLMAGILASLATVAAVLLSLRDDERDAPPPQAAIVKPKETARIALRNFHGARFEALWQQLHPVDKSIVSQERYVGCQRSAEHPAQLLSLTIDDPIPHGARLRSDIPPEDVKVVDATVRARSRGKIEEKSSSVYVARRGDDWLLLLWPNEYDAFRRDRCPYGSDSRGPKSNRGESILGATSSSARSGSALAQLAP